MNPVVPLSVRAPRRRPLLALAVAAALLAPGALAGEAHAASGGTSATPQRDSTIVFVQRALGLRATGLYDRRTRRGVRRFQRRHGLAVDGVLGGRTLATLRASARRPRSAAALPAVLVRIARCESGGNPRAVSSSERYRGKYQFDLSTWRSLGGTGDPAEASEAEQDRLALKLYKRAGTAPWRNCA